MIVFLCAGLVLLALLDLKYNEFPSFIVYFLVFMGVLLNIYQPYTYFIYLIVVGLVSYMSEKIGVWRNGDTWTIISVASFIVMEKWFLFLYFPMLALVGVVWIFLTRRKKKEGPFIPAITINTFLFLIITTLTM